MGQSTPVVLKNGSSQHCVCDIFTRNFTVNYTFILCNTCCCVTDLMSSFEFEPAHHTHAPSMIASVPLSAPRVSISTSLLVFRSAGDTRLSSAQQEVWMIIDCTEQLTFKTVCPCLAVAVGIIVQQQTVTGMTSARVCQPRSRRE